VSSSGLSVAPVGDILHELHASLEQLRMAEEELRQQNDELVRARTELELERERYEDLFQFAPVGYLVTDVHGLVREANWQAAELLEVPQLHLLGKPLASFVDVGERRDFRRRLAAIARGATEGFEWDVRLRTRRGGIVHGELAVRAFGPPGRVNRDLRWMVRDVQERRRASLELERRVAERTAELSREQARLTAVMEQIPAGLLVQDARSRRIGMSNREAGRLLGSLLKQGTTPELRVVDADGNVRDGGEWPFWGSVRGGRAVSGELVRLEVEGSLRVFEVNATPVRDRQGEVVSCVVVFRDVTDREQREQAEREFVANAAHELQTPLAAIASAAEVLQAGAKENERDRDLFLAHIEAEAERLARLVRSLLLLAQVQTGKVAPSGETIRLRPLLADIAGRIRPAKLVKVEVRCPSRLSTATDRELLEQALVNVAGNAAKYTERGKIVLSAARENGAVVLEVRDTGPGIPPEERELVRRRFTRGEARDRTGFGLGLAIADQAARALGGRLELDSPAGGTGTVARIVLPGDGHRNS
jgi:PAS domain S-box-containing protein